MSAFDPAVLITAFLAGLLGSGHCFGMCGGIAGSLGALSGGSGRKQLVLPALQFNLGRLLGYAILGAIAAGIIGAVGEIVALKAYAKWFRVVTAVMVMIIGLQFLVDWGSLNIIEKGGAGIWKKIAPIAAKVSQRNDWVGRTGLGICWGFLPCGLVYTVLVTAASTGNSLTGALTMFSFGVGTAPAMMGLTIAAPALATFLSDKLVRRIVGFSLIVLAIWMMMPIIAAGGGHAHH
jgi:sulfite exporter TauE/SafE